MPFGTPSHRFESLASTNDTARDFAFDGAAHGTAVLAREQTRGRGTKGRTWHSPAGLGLYVSFVVRGPEGGEVPSPHLLPLVAGLAAADALAAEAGVEARLKWPNDLVHDGRKIGGILSEAVSGVAAGGFAVVGVGLNVGHAPEDFPPELRATASSVRMAGGAGTVEGLYGGLCRALDSWYNALARGEKGRIVAAAEARLAFPPGEPVRVTTDAGTFPAVCRGLDPEGRLVVERAGAAGTVVLDAVLGLDGG
ncbi:MAG TPA: biotin--[acetyl-CoA-carboxylase] ligase [Acidobacteriota bacterium]|nr:biotin--[acetyl-CoA-carboxylase] ligase [Acidobacteriota bacterium]